MTAVLARPTDPATSHESAARVDGAGSRAFVMLMAHEHGPMTDYQLSLYAERVKAPWSLSRLRTARSELMESKYGALLRWAGRRGPSEKSATGAQVWEVAS